MPMDRKWDTSPELFENDKLQYVRNVLHEVIDTVVELQREDKDATPEDLPLNVIYRLIGYNIGISSYDITKEFVDDMFTRIKNNMDFNTMLQ